MNKYLVSAAVAATVVAAAAFAVPASAQGVGLSVGVNDGYYGGGRGYGQGHHYGHRPAPGIRVYSGRSSYRDDCHTKRVVKWRHGKKIIRETRVCD
jgi:hypothetical protein